MSGTWLDSNYLYTSNRYCRTYVQGFMDISGGNLIVRNNNLYLTQGDASINGNLLLGYDASINRRLFVGSDASINGLTLGKGGGNISLNSAFGYQALTSNTSGTGNTGIGYQSLTSNTIGSQNTAIGCGALKSNTEGYENTAMGRNSMANNTTGYHNTALGKNCLDQNTTGNRNSAIGYQALYYNTTGSDNIALGSQALFTTTTGGSNTAVGTLSLVSNTTGSNNVALGYEAIRSTTGGNNTAIGYQAGYAGTANTTGSNNTYIGYQAQANGNNYSNSTAIGTGATITASNQVVLGTTSEKVIIPNQIQMSYTSNPTLSVGSIGYVYSYTVTGAGTSFGVGSTKTVVSFTNTPVGIYILFINLTVYDVASNQRVDLTHSVATNITYLSNSNNLEFSGGSAGKIGINATYPLKITNATNQLTILVNNVSGTNSINITGGYPCLMRIA